MTVLLVLIALMLTLAVPVETTLKMLDVKSDEGFIPVPPEPAPDTENNPANDVFDPFAHTTDPVLDGGLLDTDILVADEGNNVELKTDISVSYTHLTLPTKRIV